MTKQVAKKLNGVIYYGWVMVAVGALAMFFSSPGQTYSFSAFIDAYIQDFGFSRSLISVVYSGATVASGFLLYFMGKLVDRFGERVMLIIVGFLLAGTAFFNSIVTTIPMLAVGFFLSRYLGQGSMTLIPGTLVPQWFKARRGVAMSVLKFGVSVASVAVPVLNVWLIRTMGWQWTWRVWGLALLIVFVPMAWLLVINTPEELGLKLDNVALSLEEVEEEAKEVEENSWHVKEAIKTPVFWELGFAAMIGPLITTGINFHFFSIMGAQSIGATEAALALGMMGIPGFVISLVSGYLIDRIGERQIMTGGFVFMALGMVLLTLATSLPLAMTAILVYGVGQSMYFVAVGVAWPNFFGRKYLGSIQGVATVFTVVGSAFGPIPFGVTYDLFGSYTPIMIAMTGLIGAGVWISLRIHKPVKKIHREGPKG